MIERLPTLCALTPGGKISYSEVIAFHNVIRGMLNISSLINHHTQHGNINIEMDMVERYVEPKHFLRNILIAFAESYEKQSGNLRTDVSAKQIS